MDLTSGIMYDIFRDHVWNDLGPLDPDWFETLSAEASEEGDVLDKDELCANQEALRANQEETPVADRRHYSPMSSTPRVYRLNHTLSPETDQDSVTVQQETPWRSRSPNASLERSSSFDLFAHLMSPSTDRPGSPVQSKTCYIRDISERLGAHMGDISWSSSLNTPPPVPSTWILTRKESESTISLTEDTSVLARKLFHCYPSVPADGFIPEAALVSEDAEVTSSNSKTAQNPTCNTAQSPLLGTENTPYTNRSAIFRKVRNERVHRRHITQTNESGCEDVEASEDRSSKPQAENPALSQWSPISLSQVQSQNFSPSVCLSAMKRTKMRGKRRLMIQHGENIGGQDPALTLKPSNADDSGFSSATIPVSNLENKTTSEKENKDNFSDSVGFRTASDKNIKVSLASLKKVKNLFNNLDEKENDRHTLPDELEASVTDKNGVSNNDWNLTVSQKAEVKELCEFLEQSDSQFDFTQTSIQNANQVSQNQGCPTLKSEALSSYSPATTTTLNQSNKAEKRPMFSKASETAFKTSNSRNNFEGRNVNASFTQGFKMASGKGITVSDQNLQKSMELFEDLVHDLDGVSTFGKACFRNETSSCVSSSLSESQHSVLAIKKAKMCKVENNVKPDRSKVLLNAQKTHLVTSCRKPLVVTAEAKSSSVDTQESLNDTASSERPKHCQKSDAEEEICPKPKDIEQLIVQSGQFKEDPRDSHVSTKISEFSSNNSVKLTSKISYESDKPDESGITNVETLESCFRTAQGTQVQVSKKHAEQSDSQFDFTQTTVQNANQVSQNWGCPTLKSEALPSYSLAKIPTLNQLNKAEKHPKFCEASETALTMNFEGRNVNTSFTQGFKMASGKGITVSDQNLQKSKELFQDLVHDIEGVSTFGKACFRNETNSFVPSHLSESHGDKHSVSAVKKARMCKVENDVKADRSKVLLNAQKTNFVAACRKPSVVTAQAKSSFVDTQESLNDTASGERPKHYQKSNSEDIEQPIVRSAQSKEDPRDSHVSTKISGFSTNDAAKLTSKISYESDKPGESGITNVETLESCFRTARGAQVQVSKKHIEKVKHLWKDFDCLNSPNEIIRDTEENSNCQSVSIDGNCVSENKQKTPKTETQYEPQAVLQTPLPASSVSQSCAFQTASGAKVNVSSESLMRAKRMWSEFEDGQSKATVMRENGSVPPTSGFLTGSGKKLSVSVEAMLKAKALFDDIGSTSDTKETPKIIKPSIAEKLKSLSSHKHSSAHTQLSIYRSTETTFPKMDSKEYCGSKNGFTTASGKTVRVSEEALNKAMELLSEGTELGNELEDNALRKASMSKKCAEPQFPKNNSENRSSSPHLTSSDGPCLRPETMHTTMDSNVQTKHGKEGAFLPLEHSVSRLDSMTAPNMEENSGCGFTTASGKKVNLSEEALKKAMKMLSNEIELNGDEGSCTAEVMTEEMNASKSQFRSVQAKYNNAANKINNFTSNVNPSVKMDITSKKETHPQLYKDGNAHPVVVNLDMLQLGGCTSTQQQFLAQEALDCTRALLEDEVRAAHTLTDGLEHKSALTHSSGQPQNQMEKKEDRTGEPVLKRPSPEELDRTCDIPKKPIPNPAWSCLGGLLKDRRVFQYHVSRHPNTPRPHGSIKEQAKPTPAPLTRRGATFVPPFLNAKAKAPRDDAQEEKEKPCTFVPPFKKHKSDIHGNVTVNKDGRCEKESSTMHTFVPPAPKRPKTQNDSTSKQAAVPHLDQVFTPEGEADKPSKKEETAAVVHSPEMEQDVKGTADASTHETLGSMGDLARDLQDMRIRKKTRQTIKPLSGSLFLTRSSPVKRLSFRAVVNGESPHKYSQKQLYQFGVDQQVCHVTSQTAESFCFNLLKFHKPQSFLESGAVQLADGGWLVPRRDGTVGKDEFYKALCDTPGVDPRLISPQWVYNHYRWIVWKLASTERAFPFYMGSVCFTPEQVLLQLKYRYDVEVDHSRRSSLRKIMEKDDASAKTIVLCVCGIFYDGQSSSAPAQEVGVKPDSSCAIVWLTDGWYSIKAQLDPPLTNMLHLGHIKEGVKLMVHGAQLSGSEVACTPLEAPDSLLLKICANSTRRVRWDTRLGFYKDPRPFVLPLRSLFSKGGAVGSVDMLILRIYPIQWMERTADGGVVFRSARAEEKEARRYNSHKQKHLEALYSKINAQFEKEDRERQQSKKRRRTVSREDLGSVVDGEELYEAVGDELSDVEALLSAEQLHTLCVYKRSVLEKRQAELHDRLRRAVEEAEASEGSCPRRDVSPVWRLSITDYLDQSSSTVYQLSVWSPSSELQSLLKEGCRYHTYNLTASEGRTGAGRATVQLTATRKTLFTRLQTSSPWLSAHFCPRASVRFTELQNPDFVPLCGEVDLTGCVISVTDQHGSSPVMYLVDEGLQVVKVRACGSLVRCGWEDVVEPRALLSLSNLQVRRQCVSDPPVLFAGDMTELSTNPRESHLQQSLGRLRQALQGQHDFFLRAEQRLIEILTPEGQSLSAVEPTTPRSTTTTAQKLRTPNSTKMTNQSVENRPATPPVFKTPARANLSTTKDPQSLRRRKALEHLSQYPPPPPLPPLNTTVSPSVKKTFCPPRRSLAPGPPAGSAGPAPVEEGWVRDEELALIDTQELCVDDLPMD